MLKNSALSPGDASAETFHPRRAFPEMDCEAVPARMARALRVCAIAQGKGEVPVNPDTGKRMGVLFEPDVVLPTQFFGTLRRQAPTKRGECQLLIAVLEDAVHCFQKYLLARDRQGQRLFREAEEWMMVETRPPRDEPTLSFEYVCDMLSLDPLYLRGGLQRWRERQLAARGEGHRPHSLQQLSAA